MDEIAHSSLMELISGIRNGRYTCADVTSTFINRILELDGKTSAYVSVYADEALLHARAADLMLKRGMPSSMLLGLPIALKDICEIEGHATSAGSPAWINRISNQTSEIYKQLASAGMIVIGKTHMVEFSAGGVGTNPLMGTPRNPWDWNHHRIPGGSSSGSAVAVAAGLAPVAIGSDTGGSVRIPSALNNLTGLKTTFGRISMRGNVPLSPSLDSIGILSRSALDSALILGVLHDSRFYGLDDSSLAMMAESLLPAKQIVSNLKIAVLQEEAYPCEIDDDVRQVMNDTVRTFKSFGIDVVDGSFPLDFSEMKDANGLIAMTEAYHIYREYVENPESPMNPYVRNRILTGKNIPARTFLSALERRQACIDIFKEWMKSYDFLLTPTTPFPACPIESTITDHIAIGSFTRAVNYLNTCAISLPAGFSNEGLPIGVQIISAAHQENLLLSIGHLFQSHTNWHKHIPAIH